MMFFNNYKFHFTHVCRAFIKKYHNENTSFTRTTIVHVSMIDSNKFQIVRRMENCLTSKPLFERIIIDREQMKLHGFTFENKSDNCYQETYSYQMDPQNHDNTIYNSYLFKSPGMRSWIRYKAHNWGVDKLNSIMEKDLKDDVK